MRLSLSPYKHLKTQVLQVLSVLTIFLMAVQPVYTKPVSEATPYNILKGEETLAEEGLVKLTLPIELIRKQAKEALEISAENPEAYVKEISRFDMDPMQKLLIVSGTAVLPADIVYDMNDIAGGGDFKAEHKFNLTVKFPSARKLALTRYFSLEVVEFKIDGQDYKNAFHRISQYLVGLLVNTSFMDWVMNVEPEREGHPENLSRQIKDLIETKGLRFRGNTVSFKVDLSKIEALKAYTELAELRLWHVSPVLLKGTNKVALQIEAGLGKPATVWFDALKKRGESETQTLEEARQELYTSLGDDKKLYSELSEFLGLMKKQLNFPMWESRQEREFQTIDSRVAARLRNGLSQDNPLFKADPLKQYDLLKEETKEYIIQSLKELKVKAQTLAAMKEGGAQKKEMPFLTKRLSQRALSQGVRFARDFQFENEQMFPELEVVIAPHLPGVVLRGVMNMDINVFMEMGLEGEGIQWSATPWRAAEDVWGAGMPFEVSLRLHAFDGGVIGLDVINFSILSGSEKTYLSKASGHGDLMATWTKMAIVETLTTMAIEDPLAVDTEGEKPEVVNNDERTFTKIKEQSRIYQEAMARAFDGDLIQLVKLAEIDIDNNPFNSAGSQEAATKLRYLFQDIIKYDDHTETLQFKLDPRLATETILSSQNTVEVWNIESLYSKILNQTFVEVSLGDGQRSKTYLDNLFNRASYFDSQDFVGIDETRKQVPSDLIISSNLQHFENFLNKLFTEATKAQEKEMNSSLVQNVEQDHYLIRDLNIEASQDGQLAMNLTASIVSKKKRGFFGRIFNDKDWYVERKSVLVSTKLNLSVEELSLYKDRIKLSPNEVFFGDELLKIDLAQAGLRFEGQTSVLEKIVNVVASDIDFKKGREAKFIKKIVLNFLHKYLNDQDPKKNGNTSLGGVRINKYAKILAHDEEILIQLNPHLMGVAFDVRLLSNREFNHQKLGLVIDKADERIDFHFSTSGNLAAVDKGELLRVMKKAHELFNPFLEDTSQFENEKALIELFDRSIYNSDYTKLSLYHRLVRVMKNYSGVLDVIKPDTSVVDQINRELGTQFGVESGVYNNRHLTASGVEIMYFLSAAALLREKMERFVALAEENRELGEINFITPMKGKIVEIRHRMILPMLRIYEENYRERNRKIVKKGPTDWNHTYYPDAQYCEGVYKLIKSWSEKSGRL